MLLRKNCTEEFRGHRFVDRTCRINGHEATGKKMGVIRLVLYILVCFPLTMKRN